MVRASQVAGATTFIRFIGYKPAPGVKDEQFIEAWRATVEQAPQPVGMLYRELCQQIPEWNAQIVDEAQHPNPFVFVDYTIYEPDLDPNKLPSLSTDIAAQYEKLKGSLLSRTRSLNPSQQANQKQYSSIASRSMAHRQLSKDL